MSRKLKILGFWLCPCCTRILYHIDGSPIDPNKIIYECGYCDQEMEYHLNHNKERVAPHA